MYLSLEGIKLDSHQATSTNIANAEHTNSLTGPYTTLSYQASPSFK